VNVSECLCDDKECVFEKAQVESSESATPQFNKNKKKKNKRPKPLLPQVSGIHQASAEDFEFVTEGGLVDISRQLWTTEKLANQLFICLSKKEAEPMRVTMPFTDNNSSNKDKDLMEQYESSNTLLYKKYIIRAEKLAGSYCEDKPNIFVINLSDLDERLQAKLLDLQITKSSGETLSRVLHSAVARIFALASLAWFYKSAREEIKVSLEP